MRERIRRSVIERFRKLGVVNGLWLLTNRALGALTGDRGQIFRYYVVAQPVPSAGLQASRRAAASPIRRIGRDDPAVTDFPRPPAVIAQRLGNGRHHVYLRAVAGEAATFGEEHGVVEERRDVHRLVPEYVAVRLLTMFLEGFAVVADDDEERRVDQAALFEAVEEILQKGVGVVQRVE